MSHVEELLQQILDELRSQRQQVPPSIGFDWNVLLVLPDHLRKTALVVARLGRVTAQEISDITHRARAVESQYCNSLVTMGYLKKERNGRKVYFSPEVK